MYDQDEVDQKITVRASLFCGRLDMLDGGGFGPQARSTEYWRQGTERLEPSKVGQAEL